MSKRTKSVSRPGESEQRSRNRYAKAPAPIAEEDLVPRTGAEVSLGNDSKTPLGVYLKMNGLSQSAFARAMGVPMRTLVQWAIGKNLPSIPAAYEIERLTKGAVPMESWLSLPACKLLIARWRSFQPEKVRRMKPELDPAGYASTLRVSSNMKKERISAAREKQLEELEELEEPDEDENVEGD